VETCELNTEKCWEPDTYTKVPNNIFRWLWRVTKTRSEICILLYTIRFSLGFHRSDTNSRLCLDDFASELGCSTATISRAINRLLKAKMIFRSRPQGNYYFYSVIPPNAMQASDDAAADTQDAIEPISDATPAQNDIAPVQPTQENYDSISAIINRLEKGERLINMRSIENDTKKVLKTRIDKGDTLPTASPPSAAAPTSPSFCEDRLQSITLVESQFELELHLGLSYRQQFVEKVMAGEIKLADGLALPITK